MTVDTRAPVLRERRSAAIAVLVWAWISVVLVSVGSSPESVRLLIVAPFCLLGVGVAALIRLRGIDGPAAFALVLLAGLSSLVLVSAAVVYSRIWTHGGGLITVAVQALVATLIVLRDALGKEAP